MKCIARFNTPPAEPIMHCLANQYFLVACGYPCERLPGSRCHDTALSMRIMNACLRALVTHGRRACPWRSLIILRDSQLGELLVVTLRHFW